MKHQPEEKILRSKQNGMPVLLLVLTLFGNYAGTLWGPGFYTINPLAFNAELDEERKAAMISNLLVVLSRNRDAQSAVNPGSLY